LGYIMGLAEQLRAGASLVRKTTTFTTDASSIGSASIDSAYAILSIATSAPCRIRFYDNEASRNNVGEVARSATNTNISSSVALIGDFSMSAAGAYSVDPILYAVSENVTSSFTHYKVEPSASVTITLRTYTVEDNTIVPEINSAYSISNRRHLPMISASLSGSQIKTGSILDSNIPQTYLLVHASGSGATNIARLRLYSTSGSLSNAAELSRPFTTEPSASAYLIADMILSGSGVTYFSPKIIGSNLENMGQNLLLIRGNRELLSGESKIHYILQNTKVGDPATSISASVSVFALEG